MKDEIWKCLKECRKVILRLIWVRITIGNEKWVLGAYGPDIGSLWIEEGCLLGVIERLFK